MAFFLKAMLSKNLKSSFSKYQVAASVAMLALSLTNENIHYN